MTFILISRCAGETQREYEKRFHNEKEALLEAHPNAIAKPDAMRSGLLFEEDGKDVFYISEWGLKYK